MKNKNLKIGLLALVSIGVLSLSANDKTMSFSTKIDSVCGIEISKATGSIDFDDIATNDQAKFIVKTNSKHGFAKVDFTNITKSVNLQNEDGYFKLNDTVDIDWSNPQQLNINHGEEQTVLAKIDKDSTHIISGDATVTTTLEIECVE